MSTESDASDARTAAMQIVADLLVASKDATTETLDLINDLLTEVKDLSNRDKTLEDDGGGDILLATAVAADDATVEFTAGIDDTYDVYIIEFKEFIPAADNMNLNLRVSLDAGATWKAGASDYKWTIHGITSLTDHRNDVDDADNRIVISNHFSPRFRFGNSPGESGSGRIIIVNPAGVALYKSVQVVMHSVSADGYSVFHSGGGHYVGGVGAIDGFQLFFNAANIASGTVSLFGRNL